MFLLALVINAKYPFSFAEDANKILALPVKLIVRDRRFRMDEITSMCKSAFIIQVCSGFA